MKTIAHIGLVSLLCTHAVAEKSGELKEPPPYSLFRATEDCSYLASEAERYEARRFDPIKYVPLNPAFRAQNLSISFIGLKRR